MNMKLEEAIVCISYFQAKPQFKNALINALLQLTKQTLTEPGCLQYDLILDEQNSQNLILIEKFTDPEAFEKHANASYIREFTETVMDEYCEKVWWDEGRKILSNE